MGKDIRPLENQWVDLYSEAGLPVGASVRLQNKLDNPAYIHEGASPPSFGPEDWKLVGWELFRKHPAKVTGSPQGLWIFCLNPFTSGGKGVIFVQEIPQ